MNAEKWHHSEIRIAINDESQGSIAKNLRCNELLYYTFIIHSPRERIFKIGEHLAKLRAKSLTVSYTPDWFYLSGTMWRGERYDGTSTRTGPLQSEKIKSKIER